MMAGPVMYVLSGEGDLKPVDHVAHSLVETGHQYPRQHVIPAAQEPLLCGQEALAPSVNQVSVLAEEAVFTYGVTRLGTFDEP